MPEAIALTISACSLVVVAIGLWQTARIHRRSTDAQMFMQFTSRFCDLDAFQTLEAEDRLAHPFDGRPETVSAIRPYFDLICQEYYLHDHKILSDRIWRLWQEHIRRIVSSPLVRGAWRDSIRDIYSNYDQFVAYIDDLTSGQTHA